jgi:hypothetical protein
MQEDVRISGVTVTNDFNGFGSTVAYPGGYFAQPTNIGTQTRTVFAVVPEANLNVGIRLSPWATFVVGYTFLYANSVARPGGQIDHVINPSQAPSIGFRASTSPSSCGTRSSALPGDSGTNPKRQRGSMICSVPGSA